MIALPSASAGRCSTAPTPDHGPVERTVCAAAHALLAKLLEAAGPVTAVTVAAATAPGLTVIVRVAPPDAVEAAAVTPCGADLLAVLGTASHPLTTSGVLREMALRGMLHGDSTVKRTLARLVRSGAVVSRDRAPRGYHLPGAF